MTKPTRVEVATAVAGAIGPHSHLVRCVAAHGSWVCGDLWDGQSDLDLIVIGKGGHVPSSLHSALEGLRRSLGLLVEPWETSEDAIERVPARRADGGPIGECGTVQFDINGFDVVQHHEIVWGSPGDDVLRKLPVPQGPDLQATAARRLATLVGELDHFRTEANRIACDALKAATIFFLLQAGKPPTRDKREVLEKFFAEVPPFEDRDTAQTIWRLYGTGNKSGDGAHQARCRVFVSELHRLAQKTGRRDL